MPWLCCLLGIAFGVQLLLPTNIIVHCCCQMERNLQDAMQVARNVMVDPRLVPGGGALEMALAQLLSEKSKVERVWLWFRNLARYVGVCA